MSHSLPYSYNLFLVACSILIAILAAYTALDLAGRVKASQGIAQWGWLLGGATALGLGIWAMHFIGMLALKLPVAIGYDFIIVLVSVLPAILASGIALFLVSRTTLSRMRILGGSLFMGLGIAAMHYTGMAAMKVAATLHYNWLWVVTSVAIAMVVSLVALFLIFQLQTESLMQQRWKRVGSVVLMGAAIPTMHYTGMAAITYFPASGDTVQLQVMTGDVMGLAAAISVGALIILGLAWITAFFDRRLSAQIVQTQGLQESQRYLQTILQGIQVGVLVSGLGGEVHSCNQAVLDLLGLTEAELQQQWNTLITSGKDGWLMVDQQEQQGLSVHPVLGKLVIQKLEQNEVIAWERSDTQSLVWLLVNAVQVYAAGSDQNLVIYTLNDITHLKSTEALLKQAEVTVQQEALLNRLSYQIRHSLDLTTILQTAVQEVRQLFDTDRTIIYQFDEQGYGSVLVEDVISPWRSILGDAGRDDCFPTEYAQLYRQGRVRAINNIFKAGLNHCHVSFLQGLQVQANLIVPILVRDNVWGLLIVHECRGIRDWQNSEIELLKRLVVQLSIAIQQAELYTQSTDSARQAQEKAEQLTQTMQTLKTTQIQLIQTEKMSGLGHLVAGIAHEVNNPINFIHANLVPARIYGESLLKLVKLYQQAYPEPELTIQTALNNLELEFIEEDFPKLLDSMAIGTERVREIVKSLRTFSRHDEATLKVVDIHQGLDSTLTLLQHRLNADPEMVGIEVIKDYGQLPKVECYASQLNQVFMHLLSNAIDALEDLPNSRVDGEHQRDFEPRPKRIRITTERIDDNLVAVHIVDNGAGMFETVQTQLFSPFFTTKPVGKGTGLGLSISYQIIVEQHNGKIWFESQVNQGTQFTIQIPIKQPQFMPLTLSLAHDNAAEQQKALC